MKSEDYWDSGVAVVAERRAPCLRCGLNRRLHGIISVPSPPENRENRASSFSLSGHLHSRYVSFRIRCEIAPRERTFFCLDSSQSGGPDTLCRLNRFGARMFLVVLTQSGLRTQLRTKENCRRALLASSDSRHDIKPLGQHTAARSQSLEEWKNGSVELKSALPPHRRVSPSRLECLAVIRAGAKLSRLGHTQAHTHTHTQSVHFCLGERGSRAAPHDKRPLPVAGDAHYPCSKTVPGTPTAGD